MVPHVGGKPTTRDRMTLLQRRQRVASAYLAGKKQWEIALAEGVDRSTVAGDLAILRRQWLQSSLVDIDAQRAKELAKIDNLERVAQEGYERSLKPKKRIRGEATTGADGRPVPGKITTETIESVGDTRFLDRIAWCIQKRAEIHGLNAAIKIAPVTPDGKNPYQVAVKDATTEELLVLERLAERAKSVAAGTGGSGLN